MDGLELKALSVLSSPSYPKSPLSKSRGRSQVQFIGSIQELNETAEELSIRPKRSDEHFGIRFYAQNVTQPTITRLTEVIPILGNIVIVDLACCGLDDILCQSLCLSLERSARSVRQLLLGGNRIGNDGARFVGQYAKKNRVLMEINLRFNLIGSAGAASLATSLRQHPRLESFNLSSNQVGSKGCAEIASAMSKCPALRRLELFANRIGAQGASAIAQHLYSSSSLVVLNLWNNSLGPSGGRHIGILLHRHNVRLRELYVGANDLQDEGMIALARGLQENRSLQILDLSSNHATDRSADAVAVALKQNESLHQINLRGNLLTAAGCRRLVSVILSKDHIRHINLSENDVSAEESQRIASSLKGTSRMRVDVMPTVQSGRREDTAPASGSSIIKSSVGGDSKEEKWKEESGSLSGLTIPKQRDYETQWKEMEGILMEVARSEESAGGKKTESTSKTSKQQPTRTSATGGAGGAGSGDGNRNGSGKGSSVEAGVAHEIEGESHDDDGTQSPVLRAEPAPGGDMQTKEADASSPVTPESARRQKREIDPHELAKSDKKGIADLARALEVISVSDPDSYETRLRELSRSLEKSPATEDRGKSAQDRPLERSDLEDGGGRKPQSKMPESRERGTGGELAVPRHSASDRQTPIDRESPYLVPLDDVDDGSAPASGTATPLRQSPMLAGAPGHESGSSARHSHRPHHGSTLAQIQESVKEEGRGAGGQLSGSPGGGGDGVGDDDVLRALQEEGESTPRMKDARSDGGKAAQSSFAESDIPPDGGAYLDLSKFEQGNVESYGGFEQRFELPPSAEGYKTPVQEEPVQKWEIGDADTGDEEEETGTPQERKLARAVKNNYASFSCKCILPGKTNEEKVHFDITKEFIGVSKGGGIGKKKSLYSFVMTPQLDIEIDVVDFHKFDLIGGTDSPSSLSFRITSRGGRENLIRHFLAFKKASGCLVERGSDYHKPLAFSPRMEDKGTQELHLLVAGESDTSGSASGAEHEPFTYDAYDEEPQSVVSQTKEEDTIPRLLVAGEEGGSDGKGEEEEEEEDVDEEQAWCQKLLQAGKCVVRYDFNPDDERMLMIRNGDILTVEAEEQGWLFCTNAYGQSGFVSPHYVDEAPQ
eukprot:TRINITY_DN81007_c0_g1_i1.p1 TRINITY_DN81007_c0_g1~~TRINITY_DN81007_c0_g1_i1.p1  ORF type:complete len:1144 (+),score=386.39 TRINITY_DN81007_c0_g1_i1:84-3434(+)